MTLDELLAATEGASIEDLSEVVSIATCRAMDLSTGETFAAVQADFMKAWGLWQRTCGERARLIEVAS